jgi:hypothetical protein
MTLRNCVKPKLPALAWLLDIDGTPRNYQLHCGTSVVIGDTGFFEGAWPGALEAMDFVASAEVFGSGATFIDDAWIVVPPSHTLEPLFSVRDGARLLVSNALPFLLAHRNDSLDPGFSAYHSRLHQVLKGLAAFPIHIPSRHGAEICVHYYHNFRIGPDLALTEVAKPAAPHFSSFESYRGYLLSTVEGALRNAADPARAHRYAPIATASRGYDSPAACAIARAAGCTEVITHGFARRAFGVRDSDSGEEVAETLGMKVTVIDRDAYLQRDDIEAPEAEFLCHGLEGADVNFLSFEALLPHRVLFSGFHGDAVWDLHKRPNSVIERGDTSGASMGEFRRRVDFFHIPVPFIGVLRHAEILAIAKDAPMRPFALDNDYDRPIPRRLVEEAGVPREAFGMAKKAVAVLFFDLNIGLHEQLAACTRQALRKFAAGWRPAPLQRTRLLANALVAWSVDFARLVLKKSRLSVHLKIEKPVESVLSTLDLGTLDTPASVMMLHWAMATIIARYAAAEAAPETVAAADASHPAALDVQESLTV